MKRFLGRVAIEHFAIGLILPITIIWKIQNGLSLSQVALTESIVLITTMLLDIPAGKFADRFSNRSSLSIGSIFHTIAIILLALGGSVFVFILAALFSGAGWAFISGSDEAHMHDDYGLINDHEFKNRVSHAVIIDEFATLIGLVCASFLLHYFKNVRFVLILSCISMALVAIYSLIALPERDKDAENQNFVLRALFQKRSDYKMVVQTIITLIALGVLYENVRFLWQPILKTSGFSIKDFGVIYACIQITSIIGGLLALKITYSRRVFHFISALMVLCLAGLVAKNQVIIICSLLLLQIIENMYRVLQSSFLNSIVDKNRATFLSFASLTKNATGAILVILIGVISVHTMVFAVTILLALKLISISLLIRKVPHFQVKPS
jgi:MFS transporter, DHA1 family, quinolone resistance protein